MKQVRQTLGTSVGKKQLMAETGMPFLLVLAAHLFGTLSINCSASSIFTKF